ncbi:MAG: hypothetical protein ACOZAQ_06575 [Pseudomonadota bacterium]
MSDLTTLILRQTETRQRQVATTLASVTELLAQAAERLLEACLNGQRIFLCPLPGAQPLAERATSLLLRGMIQPRPGLPVILLHPLAGEDSGCAPRLASLAAPGDILLLFNCGRQDDAEPTIGAGQALDMRLIMLGAPLPPGLVDRWHPEDLLIALDTPCPATMHEAALAAVHALCNALDHRLLGLA